MSGDKIIQGLREAVAHATQVDRLARAMYAASVVWELGERAKNGDTGFEHKPWNRLMEHQRAWFRALARAAFKEMEATP